LYMVEEFTILGLGKIYDYQKKYTIIHTFLFIAEIRNSAIFYIALSNPKGRIVSMHPMHPLIFEYHPDQNPPPFE